MTATTEADASTVHADIAAEQIVLGGCLWDPATLAAVRAVIDDPQAFVRPAHQLLFAALCAAAHAGEPTDAVGLWRAIAPNRIPGIDGTYLHTLLETCPVPTNGIFHASALTRLARLRHWQEVAARLLQRASVADADPDELDMTAWAELENAVAAHGRQRAQAAEALGRLHTPVTTSRRPGHPPGYAAAALRGELDRILTGHGTTGAQLGTVRAAAANLARLIADGSLTSDLVTHALATAGATRGLDAAAVAAAIHAGLHTQATERRTR